MTHAEMICWEQPWIVTHMGIAEPPQRLQTSEVEASKHANSVKEMGQRNGTKSFDWWYTYPSEKYESQLGLLFPTEWKVIKFHGSKPPTSLGLSQKMLRTKSFIGFRRTFSSGKTVQPKQVTSHLAAPGTTVLINLTCGYF